MIKKPRHDVVANKVGHIFNDPKLLTLALTHRSVGSTNNERLEFLGDSILNFSIAEQLFRKFPKAKEGELSRLRASLVRGETLAEIALEWSLGQHLILGEGELKSGGFRRASILADAVEAILGAIYEDAGMNAAVDRVQAWFSSRLDEISLESNVKDAKSQLQEWLQSRKNPLPIYEVAGLEGEAHCQAFTVTCTVSNANKTTSATAANRKQAEKEAAQKMLESLKVVDKNV